MRLLIWAFVASLTLHTLLFATGAYYVLQLPLGGYHPARPLSIAPPPPEEIFGDEHTFGDAINMSPGDIPMQAHPSDQSQAWLSHDAVNAVNVTHAATPAVTDPADNGAPGFGKQSLQAAATPRALKQPPIPKAPPANAQNQQPNPAAPAKPADPTPTVKDLINKVQQAASGGSPGSSGSPGDVAPSSDRDSDPFSKQPQVEYRYIDGKVVAQNGRWVKTVKPDLSIAAENAAGFMPDPRCEFVVVIDVDGTVVKVVPLRSSGKDIIDLPCENVLYDWKFEPKKDSRGRPMPDIEEVTFVFRQ